MPGTSEVSEPGGSEVLRVGDGMNGAQTWSNAGFGDFQVVVGLEVEPVMRRLVKFPSKQQGQFSSVFRDARGNPLDGVKTYKLRMPACA